MIAITDAVKKVVAGWVVLVIDDEMDSLEVAQRVLRFHGATVHTASNGSDGLELARTVQPTFILSDLSMPVMDGWELLSHLQEDPATAHIPVVALTAHAMQGDRERVLNVGFYNYLTKPLSPLNFLQDLLAMFSEVFPEVMNNPTTLM
jgi:CheY-like chemotaxis protein